MQLGNMTIPFLLNQQVNILLNANTEFFSLPNEANLKRILNDQDVVLTDYLTMQIPTIFNEGRDSMTDASILL